MDKIEIIEYSDKYKDYFRSLNYEWLREYFTIEPADECVLSNPQESIIDNGGLIYFAKRNDEIIGTFALLNTDYKTFELAKMAVTKVSQNQGIGKILLEFAIEKAKELKKERIILYSNTILATAVKLYLRYGFRSVPVGNSQFQRTNIKMELVL